MLYKFNNITLVKSIVFLKVILTFLILNGCGQKDHVGLFLWWSKMERSRMK